MNYTHPPIVVPSRRLVDDFIETAKMVEASSIDILLYAGSPRGYPKDSPGRQRVPFFSRYIASGNSRDLVWRDPELLNVVSFALDDEGFQHSLGLTDLGSPWSRLRDYGISCGEFCARNGKIPVNVFQDYPCYGLGRTLVRHINPDEITEHEPRIPLFLFL